MTRSLDLTWPSCSTPPAPLATDALHLWRVRLEPARSRDAVLDEDASWLPAEEHARARRYLKPVHGSLWAQSRRALRTILAHYTHTDAPSLCFELGEYGKPALPTPHDLAFNLSHSHGWALLGVARGHDTSLGVDVELCSTSRDLHALAARVFSPREQRRLHAAHDPAEVRRRFYATWTQKEAYIKALGMGLSLPLEDFDVDDTHFAVLQARHASALPASTWHMLGGMLDTSYAFAACMDRQALALHTMTWAPPTVP